MPRFGIPDNIEKLILPSSAALPEDEQCWVEMDTSPFKIGDTFKLKLEEGNDMYNGVLMLANRIKSWNNTDANNAVVPVTVEAIGRFNEEDLTYLIEKMEITPTEPLTNEEKKT